jgi:AcrR family transcriptional regulator
MSRDASDTRQQILRAALKRFADGGYAATSVQQIVDDAQVSKPALYYHFADKARLFEALVHEAHDLRYEILQKAATQNGFRAQAETMLAGLFECFQNHRDLMRIAFATMFAAPREVPENMTFADRCERNFEFLHHLIQQAQQNGELDARHDSRDLAFGFYGVANFYLMARLVIPDFEPDANQAGKIVDLFLSGAAAKSAGLKSDQPKE